MRLWSTCVLLASLLGSVTLSATTYLPVSFQDLVAKADVIFAGDVVDVRPFTLRTRDGTVVKTRVTFRVTDPIYGTTSLVEVFDFLGGEADGVGMAVEGMPTFTVGDRRIVFARRGQSINPIVGFTQGLLRVRRDASGVERVFTSTGAPVAPPGGVGSAASRTLLAPADATESLPEFRGRVLQALSEAHKQ